MAAEVKILVEGFTNADSKAESGGEEKTCPTVSLVRDEGIVMVVDPGAVDSQQILVDKLKQEGLEVKDVNFVCITHSHVDHYMNVGMFPNAKILEYFGVWDKGRVEDWREVFSENIMVFRTPGHDNTSITLFVRTEKGMAAVCGDVFWKENYPEEDLYATEPQKLEKSRRLVLEMADWVVPGHGAMYKVRKGQVSGKEEPHGIAAHKTKETVINCKKCRAGPWNTQIVVCAARGCVTGAVNAG